LRQPAAICRHAACSQMHITCPHLLQQLLALCLLCCGECSQLLLQQLQLRSSCCTRCLHCSPPLRPTQQHTQSSCNYCAWQHLQYCVLPCSSKPCHLQSTQKDGQLRLLQLAVEARPTPSCSTLQHAAAAAQPPASTPCLLQLPGTATLTPLSLLQRMP
jgi:hypothetical protein